MLVVKNIFEFQLWSSWTLISAGWLLIQGTVWSDQCSPCNSDQNMMIFSSATLVVHWVHSNHRLSQDSAWSTYLLMKTYFLWQNPQNLQFLCIGLIQLINQTFLNYRFTHNALTATPNSLEHPKWLPRDPKMAGSLTLGYWAKYFFLIQTLLMSEKVATEKEIKASNCNADSLYQYKTLSSWSFRNVANRKLILAMCLTNYVPD